MDLDLWLILLQNSASWQTLGPVICIGGLIASVAMWAFEIRFLMLLRRRTRPLAWFKIVFWQSRHFALWAVWVLAYFYLIQTDLQTTGKSTIDASPKSAPRVQVLLVDLSRSMLCQDMPGGRSRLDSAKSLIQNEIRRDPLRARALLAYAAELVAYAPPTRDTAYLLQRIREMNPEQLRQGSNPGQALAWIRKHFAKDSVEVLWLSDIEDFQGGLDSILGALGPMRLGLIPIGTIDGAFVPGSQGRPHLDRQGQEVYSSLDTAALSHYRSLIAARPPVRAEGIAPRGSEIPHQSGQFWIFWIVLGLIVYTFAPRGARFAPWHSKERDMS